MRKAHCRSMILAGLILGACSGEPGAGDIAMDHQHFEPDRFTVSAGETVRWVNDSDEPHTVTAYEDSIPEGASFFASGGFATEDAARGDLAASLIDPGESFEVTLDEPGTYRYFCLPHENTSVHGDGGMKGTIIVE